MSVIGGLGTAVSGLKAAQTQLNVSADNVANARSVGAEKLEGPARSEDGRNLFRPSRTTLAAQENGGVRAGTAPVQPTSVQRFSPDAADANAEGLVNRPNVSLVQETATQIRAQTQFAANLATVRAADEMAGETLDITE